VFDLPFVRKEAYEKLTQDILSLRRSGANGKDKPHKLIMLLTVFDLFDKREISDNKIYLNDSLINSFETVFGLVCTSEDWYQPGPPFFHLRSSDFWNHKVIEGREEQYLKLKTSGGGLKRTRDNIEYAYFSEYAYHVVCDVEFRKALEKLIISLINPNSRIYKAGISSLYRSSRWNVKKKRIGTMFHETFPLNRPALTQILNMLFQKNSSSEEMKERVLTYLKKNSNLGPNYIKAMPRYAIGCGLMDAKYETTDFGITASETNPNLDQAVTQWLMHYHLAAPYGPGPLFWCKLVKTRFRSGDEFSRQEIAKQIGEIFEQEEGKALSPDSAKSTATIFLGTYTRSDSLGNLGLIEVVSTDQYRVLDPEPPSTWTVAYALLHWWENWVGDRLTINLSELHGENGITDLFMIGKGRMNSILEEMQQEGILELYRVAPPYQVVLLCNNKEPVLRKMYGI